MVRRAWIAALLLPALALAQEEKTVRLELTGGEVLEGKLDGFADRVYRVRQTDGTVREVREEQVARVEFGTAAGRRRSASEVAGEVLAKAEASGALAARVLGTQRFEITRTIPVTPGVVLPARRWLLEAQAALEGQGAARELRLELELIPEPGNRSDPQLPRVDADGLPLRIRWWVGLDGRALRADTLSLEQETRWSRSDGRWKGETRERGRVRPTTEPWHDDLLPDALLALVLAPLHDQGLPAGLGLRLLRMRRSDGPATVRHLRLLPGEREVAGAQARVLELVEERSGEPVRGALRFLLAGGRLVRLESEEWGMRQDVAYLAAETAWKPLDVAAFAARLIEWKAERPPLATPAVKAASGEDPPPDEVARLIAAARREGRLGPWERWYVSRAGKAERERADQLYYRLRDQAVIPRPLLRPIYQAWRIDLIRVSLRHQGAETVLEVAQLTVGEPARERVDSCAWDAEGRLAWTRARERDEARLFEQVEERRGATLHTVQVTRRSPSGSWPGDEQREERTNALRPGEVPELAWTWLLPCLGLPERLRVDGLATAGEYELRGPRPAGEDGLALFERGRALPFPPGARPERAWLLGQDSQEGFRTHRVVWLGPNGDHLGSTETSGLDGQVGSEEPRHLQRVTVDEADTLFGSGPAKDAAQGLRRLAHEDNAARWLEHVVGPAQRAFRAGDPDQDGQPDWARSLGELVQAGLVSGPLSGGFDQGYRFELVSSGERWLAVANPVRPEDGRLSFAITEEERVLVSEEPVAATPDARPPAGLSEWKERQ